MYSHRRPLVGNGNSIPKLMSEIVHELHFGIREELRGGEVMNEQWWLHSSDGIRCE